MVLPLYLLILFFVPAQSTEMKPLDKLSDYGFFHTTNLSDLNPEWGTGVREYRLNSALYSNGAEKLRFIRIPEGKKAIYNDSIAFDFPVGTFLIKNFYYDDYGKKKGRRMIETRLLVRTGDEWEAWPYLWNTEQTDAYYDVAGARVDVAYTNRKGKQISISYKTPNKNECKGCHSRSGRLEPIGPTARNLNRAYETVFHGENQLENWIKTGILEGNIENAPRLAASWDMKESLDRRARAYLDVNCGNCHNRLGPASTSGLYLDWWEKDAAHLGVLKSPVAAGRGSGGLSFDIVPGEPGKSILVYRMKTTDPGIAMPEIGREQIHAEGVKLIEDWIRSLK